MKVLIAETADFTPEAVHKLREAGCEVELRELPPGEMRRALFEYDAIWFRLAHRITRAELEGAVRARVLICAVTGLDHIDVAACSERGIAVVSLKGEVEFLRRVRATAELTVGLALSLLRHIPAAFSSVREGAWDRDRFRGRELFERTVLVIGLGRLGTIVAGYFEAMGMRVSTTDRGGPPLTELLPDADVVSLHVSYDASTHHLISAPELAAMKRGAVLINTSRGGVIDDGALLSALGSGHLGGAALDVLEGEPKIDAGHPLVAYARTHDNLIITPHIGGSTYESIEKCELFIAERAIEAMRRIS
jgi:D-3-phosphoglycerate dehydrogenase